MWLPASPAKQQVGSGSMGVVVPGPGLSEAQGLVQYPSCASIGRRVSLLGRDLWFRRN